MMASVFSLSALLLIVFTPMWARLADRFGRKPLIVLGLGGYTASMLVCGAIVFLYSRGSMSSSFAFGFLVLGRSLMGMLGGASGPAIQAFVADRTDATTRAKHLAMLTGGFGVGAIVGPLLAPLLVLSPLGLAGPMFAFSATGAFTIAVVSFALREGRITSHRGALDESDTASTTRQSGEISLLRQSRLLRALLTHTGVICICSAGINQTIGFAVIDVAGIPHTEALKQLSCVMASGAVALVATNWLLVPLLHSRPYNLIHSGICISAFSALLLLTSTNYWAISIGYAVFVCGNGLAMSGVSSAASLEAPPHKQATIAGMMMSINGGTFLLAPAFVALHSIAPPAPYMLSALLMLGLLCYSLWKLR
jgi:predicted MFS family arabinose efflux permease